MSEIVNNAKNEFAKYLKKYTIVNNRFLNGIDVGCGTCRIDDMITSIDQQPDYRYAHAQFVWNCHDLDLFADEKLDFIFSSHCLEDFEDIPVVFLNWWKKIKVGGRLLLLLPDMEKCDCEHCKGKSRYASVEDYQRTGVGNPSHRTNVGKKYITTILTDLKNCGKLNYKIDQIDTIPHNESCSFDVAIVKLK